MSRRIVADCSALIPCFFPERREENGRVIDLSYQAGPLLSAIRAKDIKMFAPDILFTEFLKITFEKAAHRRGRQQISMEDAERQWQDFQSLRIIPTAAKTMITTVTDLVFKEKLSPPDSWYLAAALHVEAELWFSHAHNDGSVEIARRHLGADRVHVLTTERFK